MSQQYRVGKVATKIFSKKHKTIVQYHDTPVVIFGGGRVRLDTGGWFTNTTKTRMNQASNQFGLGFNVFQEKHKWYAQHKGKKIPFVNNVLDLV